MADMEMLRQLIYHERQQSGSMLCAQHALNSLLQEHCFSAPDLADVARALDELEQASRYDEATNGSANMDDTGFFSVQVIEKALSIYGLNLVRWRSEEMRMFQDRPHAQLAFILNLDLHWFTLRRFGSAPLDIDNDAESGLWFNLNSSLEAPEWVSNTYLGMFLQQAEADGYSVFAVTQADPGGPIALPRNNADFVAAVIQKDTVTHGPGSRQKPSTSTSSERHTIPGLEDEDFDLQAALQASLAGFAPPSASGQLSRTRLVPLPPFFNSDSGAQTPTFTPGPSQSSQATPGLGLLGPSENIGNDDGGEGGPAGVADPVAASMARNQRFLRRMQQEQEFAQRELWADLENDPHAEARRARRRHEEEQEQEQLRRVIEESEAMARRHFKPNGSRDNRGPLTVEKFYKEKRMYDDDDAELQAALKASLDNAPAGWQFPEAAGRVPTIPAQGPAPAKPKDREDADSTASEDAGPSEVNGSQTDAVEVDMEEMRRRRLAKFGY